MAHNLEMVGGKASMFSVKIQPWHKLGKILDNPPTSEEAIIEAGLDWDVEKRDIYWKDNSAQTTQAFNPITPSSQYIPYKNRCALVRTRDNVPLSIVSNNYKPLQNKAAFGWFDTFVQTGDATYETAGSLQGGKKIWVLAKLKTSMEIVKGDEVRKYLLLANGHDGVTGIMIQNTPIRVVCENTLMQSLGAGLVNTIWHHGDIVYKMDKIKNLLGLAEKEFSAKQEVFRAMAKFQMDNIKMGKYVNSLIPNAAETTTDRVKSSVTEAQEKVWDLMENGLGSDIPGVKGTMWGAYNSAVEFSEYHMAKKVRDTGSYQLFGLGSQFKRRAYDKAVEMVEA